jgi:hypothetical protein
VFITFNLGVAHDETQTWIPRQRTGGDLGIQGAEDVGVELKNLVSAEMHRIQQPWVADFQVGLRGDGNAAVDVVIHLAGA